MSIVHVVLGAEWMPLWMAAGLWGLLGASALLISAAIGYFVELRQRIIAGIMAFGSGVLKSALAFDLMDESFKSSSAGMKNAQRSRTHVFGVWGAIALTSAIASLLGYAVFRHLPTGVIAATVAVAAGAILSMLVDTMIPGAFQETHD